MNFIAANGDTVPRAKDAIFDTSLKTRVFSALILAPIVVGAVYVGRPIFDLLVLAAVVIMAWEWRRLCTGGQFDVAGIIMTVGLAAAVGLTTIDHVGLAALSVAGIAMIVLVATVGSEGKSCLWTTAGIVAIGVTGIALIMLRRVGDDWMITIWFLLAIWATDIFAYFVGRSVGGPKLAPKISPGKTWSGLVGGVIGAICWSMLWALWTGAEQLDTLATVGGFIAIFAQLGDLGVSRVKRHYGAKDTGTLIPGHGGLLDRVDGFIGAAPIAVFCVVLAKGDMSLWT